LKGGLTLGVFFWVHLGELMTVVDNLCVGLEKFYRCIICDRDRE
jgi:hypothetical protein